LKSKPELQGRIVKREVEKFRNDPSSVRNAMILLILATIITMLIGGFLVWLFDRKDFPNIGIAWWWSLQTVTTVGYGDVVPHNTVGRVIGAVVLVDAIAFLSIITATITSAFVEQARRRREEQRGDVTNGDLHAALKELTAQVDQLQAAMRQLQGNGPEPGNDRDG
jgi:voltage-gated potassium channel